MSKCHNVAPSGVPRSILPVFPGRGRPPLPVMSVNGTSPDAHGNVAIHIPEVTAPSTDPSAAGKAADAKATGDAISRKADKAVPQTAGNFAALDEHGNLKDSGKKPADYEFESGSTGTWTCTPAATQYGTPFSVKWTVDPTEGEGWALFAGDTKQGRVLGDASSTELSWSPGAGTAFYDVSAARQFSWTEYHPKGQPDVKLQPAGAYVPWSDVDDAVTPSSKNPVTSDGIAKAVAVVDAKADAAQSRADTATYTAQVAGAEAHDAQNQVNAVKSLIPSAATERNPLVDKATMNSSIATNTANFLGTYSYVNDLHLPQPSSAANVNNNIIALALRTLTYEQTPTNNDYVFVSINYTPTTDVDEFRRFKFNGTTGTWAYEYTLNNSSFTAAQWAAINSGITSGAVAKLGALPTAEELSQALAGKMASTATGADIPVDATEGAQKIDAALARKASTADATLTERFSEWTTSPAAVQKDPDDPSEGSYPVHLEYVVGGWQAYVVTDDDRKVVFTIPKGEEDATSLTWTSSEGETILSPSLTAVRVLRGYTLGTQADKPLASEAEAEALRQGKQDALTPQQLANIAAVSDALAFDATHSYAVGDPVVYNGTLYTFTAAHTGAWTGSDVSAVDIIARLANKLDKSGGAMDVRYYHGPLTKDGQVVFAYGAQGAYIGLKSSGHTIYIGYNGITIDGQSFALTAGTGHTGNLAALDANGNPTDSGVKASDKLDSTSAAPAFSTSSTYAVDERCTYNGALYRCTTAVTTAGAWTGSTNWTAEDMTTPDATLDVTAPDKLLRLVATNGDVIWGQGYNLSMESSATVLTEQVSAFTFAADAAADQAIVLPSVAAGKVGDFILDVTNLSANDRSLTLTGLDSAFSVVVKAGDDLSETLTVAAGEMARYYFTMTAFRVNSLPTWQVAKEAVENGGAQS